MPKFPSEPVLYRTGPDPIVWFCPSCGMPCVDGKRKNGGNVVLTYRRRVPVTVIDHDKGTSELVGFDMPSHLLECDFLDKREPKAK